MKLTTKYLKLLARILWRLLQIRNKLHNNQLPQALYELDVVIETIKQYDINIEMT